MAEEEEEKDRRVIPDDTLEVLFESCHLGFLLLHKRNKSLCIKPLDVGLLYLLKYDL